MPSTTATSLAITFAAVILVMSSPKILTRLRARLSNGPSKFLETTKSPNQSEGEPDVDALQKSIAEAYVTHLPRVTHSRDLQR